MNKQEVLDKIEKIKANSALPEKQRGQLLEKYNSLLAELEKAEKPVKAVTKKETPAQKKKVKKVMEEFKEGDLKTSTGKKVTKRKQAVAIALSEAGLSKNTKLKKGDYVSVKTDYGKHVGKITGDYTDEKFYVGDKYGFAITGIGDRIEPERLTKVTKSEYDNRKKAPHELDKQKILKSIPKLTQKKVNRAIKEIDAAHKKANPDYDCEQLIKEVKEKRKKSKEAAVKRANAPKKTEATKVKESIEKVSEKIEKKYEAGKLTKVQILNLIMRLKKEIKELEKLMKETK